MATTLHWVNGPWPGKLALAARPRGGDWLADDIADWRRTGVDAVLSLLTAAEEESLDLTHEAREVKANKMHFLSLPIPDRQVPGSESEVAAILEQVNAHLSSGKDVVVHCRQGVGRSGLIGACLLVSRGLDPSTAVHHVSTARGLSVPETDGQRRWIDRYAAALAGAK
jgi:protein-tyrosine phosphatase